MATRAPQRSDWQQDVVNSLHATIDDISDGLSWAVGQVVSPLRPSHPGLRASDIYNGFRSGHLSKVLSMLRKRQRRE